MPLHSDKQHRGDNGFSIVEIMVGMVIGMLGILVIMNIFAVSEGQKRTTTSGSDAQTNGGIALSLVERDVRMAGYGFASMFAYGNICPAGIQIYNNTQAPPNDVSTSTFTPVQINPAGIPAGDANTSTISVLYGTSSRSIDGIDFKQGTVGAGAAFILPKGSSRASINLGDTLIVTPNSPGLACTTIEVTGLPGSNQCGTGGNVGGSIDDTAILHTPGTYENFYQNCQPTAATHNRPPGPPGVDYSTGAPTDGRLYTIGGQPVMRAYAVRNSTLTVCDGAVSNCADAAQANNTAVWVPIADNIVSLRAVYGRDTNLNGDVDQWNTTAPADVREVIAMRIAVVARSGLLEKTNAAGQCDVTTVQPTWKGSTEGAPINLSGISNFGCYRYKTFQATVPLRNMIWKTQ